MSDGVEFVTDSQWDSYARRIFNENMKKCGQSLSEAGIARRANSHILEIRPDQHGMLVIPGWREAMRKEEGEPGA